MVKVPWPLSNNPGREPPEGTGRLINVFVEPRGDETPIWRRAPGATVFARVPSSGSIALDFDINARGASFLSTFFEFIGYTTWSGANAGISTSDLYPELTFPTGTEANDLVFLQLCRASTSAGFTTSTGYTALVNTTGPDGISCALHYKVSTGESGVRIVVPGTGVISHGIAYTIRGAMTTAPICDTGTVSTGATGDPDAANVTLTTADGLVVACGWIDDDQVTSGTAPTNFGNAIYSAQATSGISSVMVAFQPVASSGSVTVSSFNTAGDDEWTAYSFTIRHD